MVMAMAMAHTALNFRDQIGRKKTLASLMVLRCTLHKMAFRSKHLDSFKVLLLAHDRDRPPRRRVV